MSEALDLSKERKEQWAKDRGLRPAKGYCLHWVQSGRCSQGICLEAFGTRRWMDHTSAWIDKEGERKLLCQPYHLDDDSLRDVVTAAEKYNLDISIHGGGWYGFETVAIDIKKKRS